MTPTTTLPPFLTPVAGQPVPLALAWQFSANGHLTAGRVGRLADRPTFLLSSLGRTIYALTGDGQLLWRANASGPAYSLAVLNEEQVAAGDDAGYVTVWNARGQRLWQYSLGSRVTAVEVNGDGLLVGGWDERLTSLSGTGELRWPPDFPAVIAPATC